jgi:hypothetical protein
MNVHTPSILQTRPQYIPHAKVGCTTIMMTQASYNVYVQSHLGHP